MKKTLVSILILSCLCGLSVYAAKTSSGTTMGQPPQNGRMNDNPSQEKPDKQMTQKPEQKPDQKPDKKPDKKPSQKPDKQPTSKPGGDKAPGGI